MAAHLAGCSPEDIASLAASKFRCVSLDKVKKKDMRGREPDARLLSLTQKAKLGEVDAFISHSWDDEPESKWKSLRAWRNDFKRKTGREPLVWIDKYCVDQKDIHSALSLLPVYITGCQEHVVLYGRTYLNRLWCVVELAVFARTLEIRRQSFKVLASDISKVDICRGVESFDCRGAKCWNVHDTSRLLRGLEAHMGGLEAVNQSVRRMLLCDESFCSVSGA
eukprot:CAMPEP_0170582812 /NCGR_PEP_ID=MMETSP0224-20130122/7788_1 /TAXON_ID=285029 /ORGANISM="Togula jolla, Strain CCCM 725" /LENGTH=221 /DNA_ID=CAMNT_0010906071 /DNA_START=50 /DNA_END=715 /DNA_ORIENTATION=-